MLPESLQKEAIKSAEQALKIKFKNKDVLRVALTHSSFAYEIGSNEFNEKLEFLGDSVLGVAITAFIYDNFPQLQEGGLAKLRANLVRAETLADVAGEIGIGDFILIGRGAEQSGGRRNASILADCVEAIIGAIFLDQGYAKTKDWIIDLFRERIAERGSQKELGDPKTTLQEVTMEKWSTLPDYYIVQEAGPAHRPSFSASVSVKGKVYGRGSGRSKKQAEQVAAKEALEQVLK